MIEPPLPENEQERLESLRRLNLLDSPAEERFDRITRIASETLDVEYAAISLLDEDRQWFKSCQSLDQNETSRNVAFCSHAILEDQPTIVPDAREDKRFADNPLVTDEPHIRFYASVTLHSPEGYKIGTLCVFDPEPGTLDPSELDLLEDLAGIVESELQLNKLSEVQAELIQELESAERKAATDTLTRLWNRGAIEELVDREIARARRDNQPLSIAMLDIDHFKNVNDEHGHLVGDEVLKKVAERIRKSSRPYDAAGRFGGEEFLIALINTDTKQAMDIAERICSYFQSHSITVDETSFNITVSIGVATLRPDDDRDELIDRADEQLYLAKERGRSCVITSDQELEHAQNSSR